MSHNYQAGCRCPQCRTSHRDREMHRVKGGSHGVSASPATANGSSYDYRNDSTDNVGEAGIDSSGNLTIGIGGGVGIDVVNGDITIDNIDTGF